MVGLKVLPEEVFAIVVPIRRAYDGMNVVVGRHIGSIVRVLPERTWFLMVELDQNNRALDTVVEDRLYDGLLE